MYIFFSDKMPYCAIVGCETGHGRKNIEKYQSFYLPKSLEIKEKWLDKIKIKRPDFIPSIHSRICAKHFRHNDFMCDSENLTTRGKMKKKRTLKITAVPSLYLSGDSIDIDKYDNDIIEPVDSPNMQFKMDSIAEIPSKNPCQ